MARGRGRHRDETSSVDDEQDGLGNPPHGEEPQGHQQKRRKRELKQALAAAEQQVLEAEEEIESLRARLNEQEDELEQLRAHNTRAAGANTGNNHQRSQSNSANPPPRTHSEAEEQAVRAAGRRCCALHVPWMQGDSLFDTEVRNNFQTIIAELEANRRARSEPGSDAEEDDPVDEFWRSPRFEIATPVDIVREVISHLDLSLAKKWFEPWFKTEFRTGMRKMRSESVSEIADQRYVVFGLADDQFGERHNSRKRGAGAKELFEDDSFMWAKDDELDPKSKVERFFRSDALLKAVKLIMTSPSSVHSDKRSAQAGISRSELWHIKTITPSILAFVAIAVRFVLSGDLVFDKVTPTANYMDIYEGNLRLLRTHRARHRLAYNAMIDIYNKALFPDVYVRDQPVDEELTGMTPAQREFYLSMLEPPEEEAPEDGSA